MHSFVNMGRQVFGIFMGRRYLLASKPLAQPFVQLLRGKSRFNCNLSIMAPPNKFQRHLERVLEARRLKKVSDHASDKLQDDPIIHDYFYFADMWSVNPEVIKRRWKDLISWKPGAGNHLRPSYAKDSRINSLPKKTTS
jgi:hypothetical protein